MNKDKLIWGGVVNEIHPSSIYPNLNVHNVNIHWGYIWEDAKIIFDGQHSDHKWFDVTDNDLHPLIKERIKNLLPNL